MKLPVIKAYQATYTYVFTHWVRMLRLTWVPILVTAVWVIWFDGETEPLRAQLSSIRDSSDLKAYLTAWSLLSQTLMIVANAVIAAALLRPILRGAWSDETAYLKLGGSELRIMGLSVVLAAISGLISVASYFTHWTHGAGLAFAYIAVCWLLMRLMLAAPAAIEGNGLGLVQSWRLTRGNVWRLLGFGILLMLPIFALLFVVGLAAYLIGYGGVARTAISEMDWAWLTVPAVILSSLVGVPLSIAAVGIAYKLLSEDPKQAPAVSPVPVNKPA